MPVTPSRAEFECMTASGDETDRLKSRPFILEQSLALVGFEVCIERNR